jgi:hypothetical protein
MQRPFKNAQIGRDPVKAKSFDVAERDTGVHDAHPTIPGAQKPGLHPDFAEKGSIARQPDPVRIVDDEVLETSLPRPRSSRDWK